MEGYSSAEAAGIAGVPLGTLDYWSRSSFLRPSLAAGHGKGAKRRYSFEDLVALKAVRDLRAAGLSLQGLRKAVRCLRQRRGDLENPLAGAYLCTDGTDVFLAEDDEKLVSVLKAPGQGVFRVVPLSRLTAELREEVDRLEQQTVTRGNNPRAASAAS